ncbi:MAG: tRNA epoxyqueuosine(34) reductase QueG [Elusimicrobia bacterium RIFOXYB2_FULL_49_7]|nr:MAG: tRNA epoxyqueuosine(34) reductase QueG [Elusimicrobia bacterium RIFOXYB2_FULL_49_7]
MKSNLKTDLQQFAESIGIPAIGFCTTDTGLISKSLTDWLSNGCHADMTFMEKNVAMRLAQKELLPGQKSVIMALFPYPKPPVVSPHISVYAHFRDYHLVVREKLIRIEKKVQELIPEAKTLCFVDTKPVLEKYYGFKAGLGQLGRNTLLINPEFGSRFFLGGILTTHHFAPNDYHSENICGSCCACIDACPTGALSANGLDGRKCLSYHTIENRGTIPPAIESAMEACCFGCGRCEAVCPFNQAHAAVSLEEWEYQLWLAEADLLTLQKEILTGFKRRFRHSALFRTGQRTLLRNIAIALGNRERK